MTERINVAKWLDKYQRWQIKVRRDGLRRTFTCPIPGIAGQKKCQKAADAWLDGVTDPNIRVEKLYNMFLADQLDRTGTGNYKNSKSIGDTWILPNIGKLKMSALTEQDFQNVLNKAYKKGRSAHTISNIRGAMTAFLKFARKSHVTKMYINDVEIPNGAPVGERDILVQDDINVLFSVSTSTFNKRACEDPYIYAYRFLAAVGLRPGELCELQKRKQKKDGTLNVHGSYNRFMEHTSGKTKNALRTFVLPELAQSILLDQERMLKKMGIISKYVFPSKDGSQLTSRELYKRWQRYQIANKIGPVSLYELRHTFVSMCKASVPEELIKPVIGHSSRMPSYGVYGHSLPGESETVAGIIDDVYSTLLGGK